MFNRKVPPGSKPIHEMSPAERLAEGLQRILALHDHFKSAGVGVKLESSTLIVTTSLNSYFIDFADDEPRSLKMQAIYEVEQGDYAQAVLACAMATERSYAAKAIARPLGVGYRLHLVVELFVADLSAFTSIVGLYQAALEDCRQTFTGIMADR